MTELSLTRSQILPPKGLLIALAAQLPLLVAAFPLHPSAPEIALGLLLIAAGGVLNVWAERLFRRNQVGVCPFSNAPVLITSGPYRVTRNPMYLGLVFCNLGVALLSGVLPNAWSSVAYFIWLHYAFVLPEEQFLRELLSPELDAYARRVPRWIGLV
jgi:protein-S-isoprenylcysteine O-methyltransferase Ste14